MVAFFSAYFERCPDLKEPVIVEEGNIQLYIGIPDNDDMNLEDAVTSEGVHLKPDNSIIIKTFGEGWNFRIMDMEFSVKGAKTITVAFTAPFIRDYVIEV